MSILWLKLVTPMRVILPKEEYEGEPADDVSRVIPVGISIMEVTVVHGGVRAAQTWASAFRRDLWVMSVPYNEWNMASPDSQVLYG